MEVAGLTAIIRMAEHCVEFVDLAIDRTRARKLFQASHSSDPSQVDDARRSDRELPDIQRREDPTLPCHPHGFGTKLARPLWMEG
jgi:hypothetical protein